MADTLGYVRHGMAALLPFDIDSDRSVNRDRHRYRMVRMAQAGPDLVANHPRASKAVAIQRNPGGVHPQYLPQSQSMQGVRPDPETAQRRIPQTRHAGQLTLVEKQHRFRQPIQPIARIKKAHGDLARA